MLNNDVLTKAAAGFKSNAKKRFDEALAALLSLAWEYKYLAGDFRFDADPELYAEALKICREMSDGCMADAQAIIQSLFEEEDEIDNASADEALKSFDMAGSHMISLLDLWIALAFKSGFTKSYTSITIVRFLNDPYSSGLFGRANLEALKWGSGYSKNIVTQLAVIGQNLIIDAARMREWREETENGAMYYIRRRGSGFICPECDELCGYPIPIDVPFVRLHSRCVCFPEYFYEPIPSEE